MGTNHPVKGVRYPTSGLAQIFNDSLPPKEIKRLIRKQIKQTLSKLLEKSLFVNNEKEECISGIKQPPEPSLRESIDIYGTLTNSVTKKSDLITECQQEYCNNIKLVYYTVSNRKLFESFPAAGTYLSPYVSSKPVFLEVIAQVEDFYICKAATQLRYLELLSMKGE